MNKLEIEEITRARDPYLWIEEVVSIDDDRVHARKYLDADIPLFQSHYTDFPLFPGALQCEAAFQASALLIARTQPTTPGHIPVIARVRNVKFRRMVRPGDTIDVIVEREERIGPAVTLRGVVSVAGKVTTELTFIATEVQAPVNLHA